jgi:hypothetical protein
MPMPGFVGQPKITYSGTSIDATDIECISCDPFASQAPLTSVFLANLRVPCGFHASVAPLLQSRRPAMPDTVPLTATAAWLTSFRARSPTVTPSYLPPLLDSTVEGLAQLHRYLISPIHLPYVHIFVSHTSTAWFLTSKVPNLGL